MKKRCYWSGYSKFKHYGGRGIIMCDEWKNNFMAYFKWAKKNGWSKGLQLDRIDNDCNYEPSNCRFTTCKRNNLNRSVTATAFYDGKQVPLVDLSEMLNIPISRLMYWRQSGVNIEEKLKEPKQIKLAI